MYFRQNNYESEPEEQFQTFLTRPRPNRDQFSQNHLINQNLGQQQERPLVKQVQTKSMMTKQVSLALIFVAFSFLGFYILPWTKVMTCDDGVSVPHGDCIDGIVNCNPLYIDWVTDKGIQQCKLSKNVDKNLNEFVKNLVDQLSYRKGEKICLGMNKEAELLRISKADIQNDLKQQKLLNTVSESELWKKLSDTSQQRQLGFLWDDRFLITSMDYVKYSVKCYILMLFFTYMWEFALALIILVLGFKTCQWLKFYYSQRKLAEQLFYQWKQKLYDCKDKYIDTDQMKLEALTEYEDLVDEQLWEQVEKYRQKHGGKILRGPGYWILNQSAQ